VYSPRVVIVAPARFFTQALANTKVLPVEVTTDKATVYSRVVDEVAPAAWHRTEAYANNRMEADHGQLKRRLRPMRGLKTDHAARIIIAGHAFIQNIRRGHYELGVADTVTLRVRAAVDELALAI
jgi:transposase-like protein